MGQDTVIYALPPCLKTKFNTKTRGAGNNGGYLIYTIDARTSAHGHLVGNKSKPGGGRIHEHLKREGNENKSE